MILGFRNDNRIKSKALDSCLFYILYSALNNMRYDDLSFLISFLLFRTILISAISCQELWPGMVIKIVQFKCLYLYETD